MNKCKIRNKTLETKDGKLLSKVNNQLKWWAEHFKEILSCYKPNNPAETAEAEDDIPIKRDPVNREGIVKAHKFINNRTDPELHIRQLKGGII